MWFNQLKNIFRRPSLTGGTDNHEQVDNKKDNSDFSNVQENHFNNILMHTNDLNSPDETVSIPPEFDYLEKLIKFRLNNDFPPDEQDQGREEDSKQPPFPPLSSWQLPWLEFLKKNKFESKQDEIILLLIGMMPHIRPDFFDRVIERKIRGSGDFPGIGGVRGKNCRFFLPTGETALFIIAGQDFTRRLQVQQLFGAEHLFWEKKIIWLEDMQNGEPSMHGRLIISPDYVNLLTYGIHTSPQFSISFPAKKIAPGKVNNADQVFNPPTFDQLVIPDELEKEIAELKSWLKYNDQLMDKFGMRNKIKQGYRTLFYGPSGTGKTFTAQILGNDLQKEVYKIDLSMVVSKYIGETEKNLELLFARAEDKGWILFFDEADAIFGKRTNVRDAHDKYANQEVSYLLQRIEDYNGLVILATNMKNNIDDAFIRRFNSILKFPFPDAGQRARIWKKSFPEKAVFREKPGTIEDIDIAEAVKKYELSGGSIMNVVHFAGIKAVESYSHAIRARNNKNELIDFLEGDESTINKGVNFCDPRTEFIIYLSDVFEGIKRELIKEGKPFTF